MMNESRLNSSYHTSGYFKPNKKIHVAGFHGHKLKSQAKLVERKEIGEEKKEQDFNK